MDCPRLKHRSREDCNADECEHSSWTIAGEEIEGCPVKLIEPESFTFLRAYRFYQDGKYPRSGGYLDQGGRYVEAMELIDNEMAIIAEERKKQQEKNQPKEK